MPARTNQRLAVSAALLLLTSACSPPSGTQKDGLVHWRLLPGYEWVNPGTIWSFETRWVAGAAYPGQPNIHAAAQPDFWQPDPGYAWARDADPNGTTTTETTPTTYDAMAPAPPPATELRQDGSVLDVIWTAGLEHPHWPHIRSDPTPNRWRADKGYSFDSTAAGELKVSWSPGTRDPDRAHIIAAATEGQWEPEPGYQESLFGPVWTAGTIHPRQACLRASSNEGVWLPLEGYHYERNDVGRIVITENKHETDWAKVFWGTVGAIIGLGNSQTHDDDSMVDRAGHAVANEVGKAGLNAAAGEVFGGSPGSCAGVILPADWSAAPTAAP